jgi:phosphoribosylanthranilate isomerase
MTRVKICALTNVEDALYAAEQGADMLGFIFAPVSKRYIEPAKASEIIQQVRATYKVAPLCIGVFVVSEMTADEILAQCQLGGVDAAQLGGLERAGLVKELNFPAYVCVRPETPSQAIADVAQFDNPALAEPLPSLQMDTFHPAQAGGTGETAPADVIRTVAAHTQRLMLAGGLTPENVAEFIALAKPYAVDVASGTEASYGKKDPARVRDFIQAAKNSVV